MKVKFWGVRGSFPVPGKDTVEYGGNTTCIEIKTGSARIVIDAGTGICPLAAELMKQEFALGKGVLHMLFTHSHWDHIQGFPFFTPAYVGQRDSGGNRILGNCNKLMLYAASDIGARLEACLKGQMDNAYFPVSLSDLSSHIAFKPLTDNSIVIDGVKILAEKLRHPNGVVGYRIEENGKSVVIATDCEHPEDGSIDSNLLKLAANTDLLIYDGQYTPQEYCPECFNLPGPGKRGYGHSIVSEGVRAIRAAGGNRLYITHHDPFHTDKMLKTMEDDAKQLYDKVAFAKEGVEIEV